MKSFYVFGTVINISFEENSQAMEEINKLAYLLDDLWSIYKLDSDISIINSSGGIAYIEVNKLTIDILNKSKLYNKVTDGFMDITCKPILDLVKSNQLDMIKEKISLVNSKNILINGNKVKLKYQGMGIDLGSIAKGYATDMIVNILDKYDIQNAILDLGGNVYVKGYKNGNKWKVGIQDPFDIKAKPFGYIELTNKSVVTSGLYERVNHIINPKNGSLVESDIKSISIIADKSIDADGLSTAFFILGKQGIKRLKKINGVDYIYVDHDRNIYLSDGIKNNFVLLNKEYKLKEENNAKIKRNENI